MSSGVAQPKPSVGGVQQFDHAVRAKTQVKQAPGSKRGRQTDLFEKSTLCEDDLQNEIRPVF